MFESLFLRELNSFSSFVLSVYFSYVCTHMKGTLGYNSKVIIAIFESLFNKKEKRLFLEHNAIFSESYTLKTVLPSCESLCSNAVYFWENK